MQSQSPMSMTPNKKHRVIIGTLATVLILVTAVGLYVWQKSSTVTNENSNTNEAPTQNDNREKVTAVQPNTPVIIYTEQTKLTNTASRAWPTVKILRKIGNSELEILAEVGKVGEFPNSYQLSPDKNFLLINLESKLQILDLTTKELSDLFIPKRGILSMSYSPDTTQLLIWDQKYAPQDGDTSYYIHRFTISSRKDEILKQGNSQNPFFAEVWREDDSVVLSESRGEGSSPYYFDVANNQIVKTPGGYNSGLLSESGKAMAVVKDTTGNPCNDFSGDAPSIYNIIDPVSGKILGAVGAPNKEVAILSFSPDDTEVFYQTERLWENRDDCNKVADKTYYKARLGTNQAMQINDPAELLSSWNENYVGATTNYDDKERVWSISIYGQTMLTSTAELNIAGQYYLQ